ncbi:MAG: hypothetical protein Q7V20_23490 [Aquabacterium sp.]|uniref:hypothetical protein n=1 Tax=Aquabacterium sp. TaxID=1872578 RepID=UPI00272797EA|nr:hypothetical protein [Aquabacterium sp.]MDO9006418.1 hypothetical protein [Aquabacterium sp.]
MKLKMNQSTLSSVSAAALLAFCHLPGHAAGDDDTPFSLKLSETVTYDTNYARNTEDQAEVVSSTAVTLGLDKSYGRQNYEISGRFGIDKHKNFKNQDNNNYDLSAGFTSGIASNWAVALNGSTSERLNSVENNSLSNRLAKNIATSHNVGANVQYGVAGRWSLLGSLGMARNSYSLASYEYQNREQNSGGLRLVYNTSDLLSFGVGVSTASSKYPNNIIAGVPEEIKQRSLDFTTNWQVTGFSRLDAILSYAKNKYKSDSNADFKGFTGRLNWDYKPTGLTTYSLSAARSTNNDGSGTGLRNNLGDYEQMIGRNIDTTINSVTTSVDGRMRWAPTAKLGFTAGLGWDRYDVTTSRTVATFGPSGKTSSDYTVVSLSSDYNFSRAIAVGCTIQQYKQSAESNPQVSTNTQRVGHDGRQFSCNASFTID